MASPSSHTATSHAFAELIYVNDAAAQAITKGENRDAYRLLEMATKKLASLAPSVLREWPQCAPKCDARLHQKVHIQSYVRNEAMFLTMGGSENFCPSPFVCKPIPREAIDQNDFKVLVAVSLFNMALACHIQYKTIDGCSQKLHVLSSQARVLYRTAGKLLEGSLVGEQREIFLAICINAMGEAQDQGNLDEIRHWVHTFDKAIHDVRGLPSLSPYILQREVFYIGQFAAAHAA